SDVLMVASGTATLEAALFATPLVICYRTSPITYAIAKRIAQVDFIGLPNIIAGREVVPEFIQDAVQAERMAPILMQYLTDDTINHQVRGNLQALREKMGEPGAAGRAADHVLELLPPEGVNG
ncbi:lipid-A-disaccharide synthase, partial [bacterium]|nr:lipid-A-disaccharide synthase [bacterium]